MQKGGTALRIASLAHLSRLNQGRGTPKTAKREEILHFALLKLSPDNEVTLPPPPVIARQTARNPDRRPSRGASTPGHTRATRHARRVNQSLCHTGLDSGA